MGFMLSHYVSIVNLDVVSSFIIFNIFDYVFQ